MSTRHNLSAGYVRQCFRYDSGKLYWIERPLHHFATHQAHDSFNKNWAGKEAGCVLRLKGGHRWKICIGGVKYTRYNLVWLMHHNSVPGLLDHENRNPTDDRIENLRPATNSQNSANCRIGKNNTSGVKGVSWHIRDRKWRAAIIVNGKNIHLGYFDSADAAHQAYCAAAKNHFGDYACNG